MSDLDHLSITNMKHKIIASLEPVPFDDELRLSFYDDDPVFCPFDSFRRLYNDAVESMQGYKDLAVQYMYKAEQAQKESAHFMSLIEKMLNDHPEDADDVRVRFIGYDEDTAELLPDED